VLVLGVDGQGLGQTGQGLLRVVGYTGQPEPGFLVLGVVGCHPPQVVPGLLEPPSPGCRHTSLKPFLQVSFLGFMFY